MIKYIVTTNRNLIKFNTETQDIATQNNISFGLDWMWIAEDDGTVNDQEVNAGDIILSMYSIDRNARHDEREVFVIKDEKLKDYYKRLIEFQDARRLKQREECEANCCDNSPCC